MELGWEIKNSKQETEVKIVNKYLHPPPPSSKKVHRQKEILEKNIYINFNYIHFTFFF